MYFQGDKVGYRGSKFPELRTKMGEVCSRVHGTECKYVVDFGNDSFVMHENLLVKYKASKDPNVKELEIHVRRKRAVDVDEE